MAGWCFRRGRDKATARERGFREQWKKDLKTKRPSQKNQPMYFFEQREQTIHDRREPTKINGSARLHPCLSRQFATVGMSESIPRNLCSGVRQRMERAENDESGSGHWRNRADTWCEARAQVSAR
jgi:hypothetical protein